MKIKSLLILFATICLTNLSQAASTCTAMNTNNLSVFKAILKDKYEKGNYEIINADWFENEPYTSKKPRIPDVFKSEENEQYKRSIEFERTLNPDNKDDPTFSNLGRYDKRCQCQKCYWTGFPTITKTRNSIQYICGGCNEHSAIDGKVIIHYPEDNLPGIQLHSDCGTCSKGENGFHNGFIYDTRLSRLSRHSLAKLADIKKSDKKYWFYCYSCKKHFLVPMNSIPHPKCVFNY